MALIILIDLVVVACLVALTLAKGFERTLPFFAFLLILLPTEARIDIGDLFVLSATRVVIVTLAVLYIVFGNTNPESHRNDKLPLKHVLLLYLAWCVVSTINSIVFTTSLRVVVSMVLEFYVLYYVYSKSVSRVETIHKIFAGCIAALVVCCVFGVVERFTGWRVTHLFPEVTHRFTAGQGGVSATGRIQSTFPHAILFANALALGIPWALYLLDMAKTQAQRVYLWVAIIMMSYNLYKTQSRGPWLALVLSLALLYLFSQGKIRKYLGVLFLLVISGLIIRPGVLETLKNTYFATLDPDSPRGSSYQYRYELLRAGRRALARDFGRSLWGFGPESFYYLGLEEEVPTTGHIEKLESCDSAIVEIMVEHRVCGTLAGRSVVDKGSFVLVERVCPRGQASESPLLDIPDQYSRLWLHDAKRPEFWVGPAVVHAVDHTCLIHGLPWLGPTQKLGEGSRSLCLARNEPTVSSSESAPTIGQGIPAMEEQVVTKVVRSLEEVKGIAEVWRSWQYHPNSDLDVYLMVLRSRPEILRPHVIVVPQGGSPDAMLVGRVEERETHFKIGYATIFKCRARLLTFIYAGLLGNDSAENCAALVRGIMKSLRQGEADAALLANVKVNSPLYRFAARIPPFWTRDFSPALQAHWSMTLPASVDEVYRRMSEHHRSEIRRKGKKLLAQYEGKVTIKCFREPVNVSRMIQQVEEVAKKTYQRGLGVGFVDSEEMRERLQLEAQRGRLRAYILYVTENPSAFWIGSLYGETFHGSYVGYDTAYGKYSPGMFLTMRVIDEFCHATGQDKVRQIDFGFGDAPYKTLLANCKWDEASVYIFAPTLKGARLNALRTLVLLVNRTLRRGLERAKLLAKIKRIWRDHASPSQG